MTIGLGCALLAGGGWALPRWTYEAASSSRCDGVATAIATIEPASADEADSSSNPPAKRAPRIQLALLLDTSNSMDGLIDQAKRQLWKIVNEFIPARRDGVRPELRVALLEYGNNGLVEAEGYIRLVCPLTDDLDKVSEELFKLTTNGGNEYCGQVIKAATEALGWSDANDDLKLIFIAGNEPFTQGPVDYAQACRAAIAKGVIVNTIHCGDESTGIAGKWKDGALLADGEFLLIDQNQAVVHVAAPQDKEIADLGVELNSTYIPYGQAAWQSQERQAEQDSNSMKLGRGSAVERAVCKASANYSNTAWDLVDAIKQQAIKLADIKVEDLPESMRAMTPEERAAYVEKQAAARDALQQKVNALNALREAYVAAKMRESAEQGVDTLDTAVLKACRKQAEARHFEFKE
jgi:hypothetical protein